MPSLCAAALKKMKDALDELDEADAPADIGAHLDLAICRLEEFLDREQLHIAKGMAEKFAK